MKHRAASDPDPLCLAMQMSPEFNLVDLLSEDDLPLSLATQCFRDVAHARSILQLYMRVGAVAAHRGAIPVPTRDVLLMVDSLGETEMQGVILSLTERGRAYLFSGRWDELFKQRRDSH